MRRTQGTGTSSPAGRSAAALILLVGSTALVASAGEPTPAAPLWSLAPIARPAAPPVRDAAWARSTLDALILARLEAAGKEPAPEAPRARLIRRLSFDITGLPPAPEEVDAFLADDASDAYERLVDRLLASPRLGERWARHWLDVVRFAESNGYERDAPKPHAWKYRDWVIGAINADLPHDRFILEQLAGDELPDTTESSLVATGFLRVGTFDDEPNDPLLYKYEQLDDLVHATSTAFLALTVKCARCHDHKFDPIPQTDYYSFLGFFWAGKAAAGEVLGYTDESSAPAPVKLLQKGDPRQESQVIPVSFPSLVSGPPREIAAPPEGASTTHRRTQLARWLADPRHPLTARVAANRLWQHCFGEGIVRTPDNFGRTGAPPTHPEALDWLASELIARGWSGKSLLRQILLSSAYRMDSIHPRGEDYAAGDPDNKLLWRQSRRRLEAESLRDAMLCIAGELDGRLGGPSFFPRLSREATEGLSKKDAAWKASPESEQHRRSVYIFSQRSLQVPLLTTFDLADTTVPCGRRDVTTVAPQALSLLNGELVHELSRAFAARVRREAGEERAIERAWRLAFGRGPSATELEAARAHLEAQGQNGIDPLTSLCHVLLNASELIHVD